MAVTYYNVLNAQSAVPNILSSSSIQRLEMALRARHARSNGLQLLVSPAMSAWSGFHAIAPQSSSP